MTLLSMRSVVAELLIYCGVIFAMPLASQAHLGGIPMLLINGEFSIPDVNDSLQENAGHRDLPPEESYAAGVPIQFDLKSELIPDIPDDISSTTFVWDFGDGTKPRRTLGTTTTAYSYAHDGLYEFKVSVLGHDEGFTGVSSEEVIGVVPLQIGQKGARLQSNEKDPSGFVPWGASTSPRTTQPVAKIFVAIGAALVVVLYATRKRKTRRSVSGE